VVGICWFEARAYCAWLSAQTGQTFRLPTEAEWEAAARGGQRRRYILWGGQPRRYAFGNNFDAARCNTFETHIRRTTPIGVFPGGKTPQGLVDMTGNTCDWTSSMYTPYPYDAADGREVPSPPGARRVVRGGPWGSVQVYARTSCRNGYAPVDRNLDVGLRVCGRPPVLPDLCSLGAAQAAMLRA
jgi:formylglycine-generating enzyme required for sulfatase activity